LIEKGKKKGQKKEKILVSRRLAIITSYALVIQSGMVNPMKNYQK